MLLARVCFFYFLLSAERWTANNVYPVDVPQPHFQQNVIKTNATLVFTIPVNRAQISSNHYLRRLVNASFSLHYRPLSVWSCSMARSNGVRPCMSTLKTPRYQSRCVCQTCHLQRAPSSLYTLANRPNKIHDPILPSCFHFRLQKIGPIRSRRAAFYAFGRYTYVVNY